MADCAMTSLSCPGPYLLVIPQFLVLPHLPQQQRVQCSAGKDACWEEEKKKKQERCKTRKDEEKNETEIAIEAGR